MNHQTYIVYGKIVVIVVDIGDVVVDISGVIVDSVDEVVSSVIEGPERGGLVVVVVAALKTRMEVVGVSIRPGVVMVLGEGSCHGAV